MVEHRDRVTGAVIAVGVNETKVSCSYMRDCLCSGEIKL